jgi:hypothetical protein
MPSYGLLNKPTGSLWRVTFDNPPINFTKSPQTLSAGFLLRPSV